MKRITLFLVAMLFAFSLNAQKTTTSLFSMNQDDSKAKGETIINHNPKNAPAFVKSKAYVIDEGFESGIPAAWTQYKLGDASSPGFVETTAYFHSGAQAMYHNDDNLSTAAEDWIVLPQTAITDAGFKLKFWQRDRFQTYYEYHGVWISTNSGDPASGDFTEVWSQDVTDDWVETTVDLASYNGQSIYIAFKYTGDYMDEWYIDDVKVGMPEPHDLAANSVAPSFVISGATATPQVGVHNFGSTNESAYEIHLVINDGSADVYDETVNATTTVASGADVTIDMPAWTPADGTYTLTATVTIADDADTSNNQITGNCTVGPLQDAYAGNATDGTYGSIDLSNGTFSATGTIVTSPFPMAEEYDGTNVYRVYYGMDFGTVAPDGVYTSLGTLTGVTGTITGLAYDFANSTMYAIILDGSNAPHLCTVDMSTYALTEVGVGTGMIIAMDFANDGFIYGPSLNDDKLYKIDPATGLSTEVGPLGININYGQDVSYDPVAEMLYTLTTGDVYKFGTYDLTTGAFTEIADFAGKQHATFVITKTPSAVSENTVEGLKMFPNPVNDILNVSADNNIDQVQVINLLGQELINVNVDATSVQVNLGQLSSGAYLVRVVSGNSVTVQKVVKK